MKRRIKVVSSNQLTTVHKKRCHLRFLWTGKQTRTRFDDKIKVTSKENNILTFNLHVRSSMICHRLIYSKSAYDHKLDK